MSQIFSYPTDFSRLKTNQNKNPKHFPVEEQSSGHTLGATTPISQTASEPGPPGSNGNSNLSTTGGGGGGMGRFLTVPSGKPSNRTLGKETNSKTYKKKILKNSKLKKCQFSL